MTSSLFDVIMFLRILFSIFFAFNPNRIVLNVCSYCEKHGFTQRMMAVLEFPPREDLNILVNGELRKGM